jgi:exodeoxyribonuclease VII small subunit
MTTKKFNYKSALGEIEEIVQKIESEEVDVDELSAMVKKAADLIKQCKTKLKDTGDELEDIIEKLDD